jgi:hypothetical protein
LVLITMKNIVNCDKYCELQQIYKCESTNLWTQNAKVYDKYIFINGREYLILYLCEVKCV